MGLRVSYSLLIYDAILFLALTYIWWFFLKRWNRYVAELKPFVRNASIFLGVGVLGRFVDLITDLWSIPYENGILEALYGISIVGVIYTMINYVLTLEKFYIPTVNEHLSGENKEMYLKPGAYLISSIKKGISEILNIIKESKAPSLIFTRSLQLYEPVKNFAAIVWVTQATDKGVAPTKLHIIQDMAIRFSRENRNALVIIDCLEYLLLYNEFASLFKFLTSLKDYLLHNGATLIILASEEALSKEQFSLLQKEFEPL